MANVQKQFDAFHAAIRLGHFDEEKILREKRDIIRDKLDERLPQVFESHGEELPDYYFRDQGSYELRTGTKPLDGDYDIDQGLYFLVSTADWKDPVTLKQRVHEALDGHTKKVRIRRPCVTVFYERSGEPLYHVDIAVYSDGDKNADGKSKLAKGRENSEAKYRVWEVSNPKALKEKIEERFKGNDAAQFRHNVRYLKRWRDENFSSDGNAAPLGIGLTVAAYDDFHPHYSDPIKGTPDDLAALRPLVGAILGRFADKWDAEEGKYVRRLEVKLPVEPWSDLFEQMTNNQMANLETKLRDLQTALDDAAAEVDPVEACKKLQKVFGDDFPVPEKKETAARVAPAIVSSSSSA